MSDNNPDNTMNPRAKKITEELFLEGTGIEYGPLHAALIEKSQYDVLYADFADRDFLRSHYAHDKSVNIERIPHIDIVTEGKDISIFVDDNSMDYVVASHVMEHIPDILGWLESNLRVLKPGGRIAVAFPDKRYCFDLKRKSSSISKVIAAHLERRSRPNFESICDHFWNVATVGAVDCWEGKSTPENSDYIYPRDNIIEFLTEKLESSAYTDVHCWIFSDEEFLETMKAAMPYSKIDYKIVSFYPTQRYTLEFYVTFERC